LCGPVGAGKSRLAWSVAEQLTTDSTFETAVVCDLHGVRSATGFRDAVTRTAGISSRRASAMGKALDGIGHLLVVLDGVDLLPDSASRDISSWLRSAPAMTCLVTSRRRIESAEGVVQELGPMTVPEGPEMEGEAAAFFLRCAGRSRPGYVPSPAEAPYLAELVRELDGLPLALELAAPRLTVMGPAVLLHRIRASRSVLRESSHAGDAPPRSFEAAMESSWSALTDDQREVLTQLSVFEGGFTAAAAETVVEAPPASAVLDVLQALRDRSMIQSDVLADGSVRLRLLQGVRHHVRKHADPKTLRRARARHASHFAKEADRRALVARTASGAEERSWFQQERRNLESVVRKVTESEHVTARAAEPALRVLLALDPRVVRDSLSGEFATLLEGALDATRDSGADPLLFGRAMALRGAVRRRRGKVPDATRDLMQALRVGETLASEELQGRARLELGRVLLDRGENAEAREHLQQALAHFAKCGARSDEAWAWQSLGDLERHEERWESAMPLWERTAALYRRLGAPEAEASSRASLAWAQVHLGHDDAAARELAAIRSLPLSPEDENRLEAGLIEAVSRHDRGSAKEASEAYPAIESVARRLGAPTIEAEALAWQALARAQLRSFGEAHALLRAAFDIDLPHDAALWSAIAGALDARVAPPRAADAAPPPPVGPWSTAIVALQRLQSAPSQWADIRPTLAAIAPRNVVIRLAIRALDQTSHAHAQETIPADALAIGPAGRWFRMPRGEVVSLERRRPLALLLDSLAQARTEGSNEPLGWDALQQAGWPGERIMASAGAHRVRVAISTLRKLGLRDALETTPEGYRLTTGVQVVRVPDVPEAPSA